MIRLSADVERWIYTRPRTAIAPVIVLADKPRELLEELHPMKIKLLWSSRMFRGAIFGQATEGIIGMRIIERLRMLALPLPIDSIIDLADRKEVKKIYPDRLVQALQFPVVPPEGRYTTGEKRPVEYTSTYWTSRLIGADKAWSMGITGQGVTVSVIDTTAVPFHPSLRGAMWETSYPGILSDTNGHGVWVGGCVAGPYAEVAAGQTKIPVQGVAPNSRLLLYKGLVTTLGVGLQSAIIEAMVNSVLLHRAKIINMSLGSSDAPENPEDDAQVYALEELSKLGVIFCVAAGNDGEPYTINTPGIAESAITVGSYNPISGSLSPFSSQGPTPDRRVKPDLVMPGENILGPTVGLLDVMTRPKPIPGYGVLSGTSMATPHCAGLCALIVEHGQKNGINVTASTIKQVMSSYGEYYGELKNNQYGWGVLTWDKWMSYAKEVMGIA
ncbi:MAG: S8 family serine peptidase [Thaumarchaeota archaeon]|nr:S8 family serine peptidase [Candidatus Calditenuaceae archaeon]